MAGQDERQGDDTKGKKSPIEKLADFVEGALEELKALLDPPRPVRIPVPASGPRRPR